MSSATPARTRSLTRRARRVSMRATRGRLAMRKYALADSSVGVKRLRLIRRDEPSKRAIRAPNAFVDDDRSRASHRLRRESGHEAVGPPVRDKGQPFPLGPKVALLASLNVDQSFHRASFCLNGAPNAS